MSDSMRTLQVELGARSYPIHVGCGLLSRADLFDAAIAGSSVLVVSNDVVAPLYLHRVLDTLAARRVDSILLPDGESHKTLEELTRIYDRLLEARHDRGTTLVALGGGVVGDMTGFAAATYQRGVDFIQLPTTLLAQVDSSVGGKTGVNHPLGKNMIGAFHQPRSVIADLDTIDTLPDREYAAGLAEVVKYGLIADAAFYRWLQREAQALRARDKDALLEAVLRSCAIKAAVVAEDEREAGRRAILNFGHTFAHAIETATGYTSWLHGEAVATGMLMAAELSARLGGLDAAAVDRLRALLAGFGLPTAPPADLDPGRFLELMTRDKKVLDGEIRLVLLERLGHAVLSRDYGAERLRQLLADACAR